MDDLYQKIDNLSITHSATAAGVTLNCKIYGEAYHIGVVCPMMVELVHDQMNHS